LLKLFKPAIAGKKDGALCAQNAITGISFFKDHTRAFLKVQDGCDNFCSYCKIPFVRGRSTSRDSQEILAEARRLAQNGFQEIVLTGICLGDYGLDLKNGINLAGLLKQMEKIEGLSRIRLSSIEVKDVDKALIKRISESKKICRHLHIPLQSGDNQILKKMNRHYSREVFLSLIKLVKKAIPGIAITTDLLVGFPGEKDENFLNSVKLIKQMFPLAVHIFPYSARQGTKAASFSENTPAQDIHKRIAYLNQIARACRDKYMRSFLNKKMVVLVEDKHTAYPDCWQGHTDNYLKVLIRSKLNLNKRLVSVKLVEFCDGLFKADFR
jgi:threonylcarbamoyladenosine tRNA methylthiotransferase MtaB